MKVTKFKQGDTFLLTCQYLEKGLPAPLPTAIRSQVRGKSGTLITEFVISRDDEETGKYSTSADTSAWPLGMVYIDVLYTYSTGVKSRTPTLNIRMEQAVTHD